MNLATKRVDSAEAAANLEAAIRAEIPSAGVQTTVSGNPAQPSFRASLGHELTGYFRSTEPIAFWVRADWSTPRPMQAQVRYVKSGPRAAPLSVLYVTRLRLLVPGPAVIKQAGSWPRLTATFDGDGAVRDALVGSSDLAKGVGKFLQPRIVIANAVYTIEPFFEIIPDDDGAILAAFTTPARDRLGLGGFKLTVRSFLEIADAIERSLVTAPGVRSAERPNAPLHADRAGVTD